MKQMIDAKAIVSFLFALSALFVVSLPAFAVEFAGGTGEPNDPYQIATAEQLVGLGKDLNLYDKNFILTADIDLSGRVFDRAVIAPEIRISIGRGAPGFEGEVFSGLLNGNGHRIAGLTIDGKEAIGLIGGLGPGAVVSHLGLEAVDVNGTRYVLGGLAAWNNGGSITNCYSTGTVTGSDNYVGGLVGYNVDGPITNCHSSGSVAGDFDVGALVGYNKDGAITDCYSTGTVMGYNNVGGLVGKNGIGAITHCYGAGTVTGNNAVGGLVGSNGGTITRCYSIGKVTGNAAIGGLVGSNFRGCICKSIWDTDRSGLIYSDGGVGLTTTEMMDPGMLGINGLANDPNWVLDAYRDYPRLVWQGTPGQIIPTPIMAWLAGNGSHDSPYEINSVDQLVLLSKASALVDKYFILLNDLDLSGLSWPQAVIPYFDGHFNGQGYRIDHLQIKGERHLGFFGLADTNAVITDLGLEAVEVNGVGSSIGGLVGFNNGGTLTNCYSTGSFTGYGSVGGLVGGNGNRGTLTHCYYSGTVSGNENVGGLVGYNYDGTINNCYSTATDTRSSWFAGGLVGVNNGTIINCYSSGTVTGSWYVGGLVGRNNHGTINNCYSTVTVMRSGGPAGGLVGSNKDGIVTNCYSTGNVGGDSQAGGLVGNNSNGTITRSYSTSTLMDRGSSIGGLVGVNSNGRIYMSFWDTDRSGLSYSAGGVDLTTTEMMDPEILGLNGLADDPVWVLDSYRDYPRLAWQGTPGKVIPAPIIDWLDGHGSFDNPYEISSVDQLILLSKASVLADKHFLLSNDLDLSGHAWSQAVIPYFNGHFNGQGHCIEHLQIEGEHHVGLFGIADTNAVITELGLDAVDINGVGEYVGGLVGSNEGGTLTKCYSTGSVAGYDRVGGLVGGNGYRGTITNCYSSGAVKCSRSASGGLVGSNDRATINKCYSSCTVTGFFSVGGLVGDNRHGIITRWCFWDMETSGLKKSAGGTGLNTGQMQELDTYLDAWWDFDETWMICEGDYPHLQWEQVQCDGLTVGP